MSAVLRNVADRFGMLDVAFEIRDRLVHTARLTRRRMLRKDSALIQRYFESETQRKLHVGAGKNPVQGWLNTDYDPLPGVAYLDATKPFPFDSNAFEFVYSEHMIEHIPFAAGQNMLRECFRVLKPNGTLRISTPNLAFLVDLYDHPAERQNAEYIRYSTEKYVRTAPALLPGFVINNFVRDWGHKFIYDRATLRLAFEKAGFCNIEERSLRQSEHRELCGLENDRRMPPGVLALESLIIEGTKPPRLDS
jgi:predicted SAM-dependent methyltransferase